MDSNTPLLQVTRTDTEPCCISLQIEVPAEQVKKALQKATGEVKGEIKMPGFRKGKTPLAMVTKLFAKDIERNAREKLLNDAYQQVREEQNLQSAVNVSIDKTDDALSPDQPFSFTLLCELLPEITLPQYKDIPLTREAVAVSDQEVDDYLEMMRGYRANMEPVGEEPVQEGDLLQVKFESTLPEDFEADEKFSYLLNSEGNWMALREPEFLPGIIDALAGIAKDQERQVDITFPEDYQHEALAGKTIPYVFIMLEGMKRTLPELDDELAKQFQCETLEELRNGINQRLLSEKTDARERQLRLKALDFVMDQVDTEMPPSLIKNARAKIVASVEQDSKNRGHSKEETRALVKKQKDAIDDAARRDAMTNLVLEKIAEAEKLELPPEVIMEQINQIAQERKESVQKTWTRMQKDGSVYTVMGELLTAYTVHKLMEWAKITEAGEAEEDKDDQPATAAAETPAVKQEQEAEEASVAEAAPEADDAGDNASNS